jgi:phospholipase D1/2
MNEGNLRIQMLRSASEWSIGLDPGSKESSIHNAYKDLIENSESFIYIENQFFMGL